ncbi:MAG: hypothetical protein RJB56_921 [Actinomycetota bacterium]|jgi:uncharacterized membrane protein
MRDERGSIAPLAIGLLLMSLATVGVVVSASSLFIEHRRLQTLAESAAVAGASRSMAVSDFLANIPVKYANSFSNLRVSKEQRLDGATVEVQLCADWLNPVATAFTSSKDIVCAEAKARAAGG